MCSKCLQESAVWSHTFKRICQKSYPPKYKNPGTLEDVSENTCNTATQTIRPSVEKYLTACQVLATNMTANPLQLPRKLHPAKMNKNKIESSCILTSFEENLVQSILVPSILWWLHLHTHLWVFAENDFVHKQITNVPSLWLAIPWTGIE